MKIMTVLLYLLLMGFGAQVLAQPEFDGVKVKWRFNTDGAVRADAVVDSDEVFVASTDGKLYALRKQDGKKLWQLKTPGALAGEPAVARNLVVVVSRDNKVYALHRKSGRVKWKFCMQPEQEITKSGWKYFTAAPVITRQTVYVGSGDGYLYALNRRNGRLDWKFRTQGQIRARPLVHEGLIYQPSNDGIVYVLDANSGELQWKFETQGHSYNPDDFGFDRKSIYTTPIIRGNNLIIGSRDGNVYAIDLTTHESRWQFSYGTSWAMSTVVDDNTVYVGWSTNNLFSAIDIDTGTERWQFRAGSHNYTNALVTGHSVYFGSADGKLYQLDKTNGSEIFHYDIGSEIFSSPVYDAETETIFLGSDDGNVYALTQSETVYKAVYQPEGITDLTQYLVVDPKVTPFLLERGYEHLNSAAALEQFIQTRIADGAASVIVFALPIIPEPIMGADPASGAMREYLESGGKVVWFGDPPNYYSLNEAGNNFDRDATAGTALLNVNFTALSESGNYYSEATQQGQNWGLPRWLKATGTPVEARDVTPLAFDEFGRVSVWVKNFGDRAGAGYVSLRTWGWNVPIRENDLELIDALARYGLD